MRIISPLINQQSSLDPLLWDASHPDEKRFVIDVLEKWNGQAVLILLKHHPNHDNGERAAEYRQIRRLYARLSLAALTQTEISRIRIACDAHGRPSVSLDGVEERWFVSFSTRGAFSLIGIAHMPLGVDLELPIHASQIPHNLLRQEEREALLALKSHAKVAWFLSLWCRKEAILKAIGSGFAHAPEALSIKVDAYEWEDLELSPPRFGQHYKLRIKAEALRLTDAHKPAFTLTKTQKKNTHFGNVCEPISFSQALDFSVMIAACFVE